jgi:hypothetical protein
VRNKQIKKLLDYRAEAINDYDDLNEYADNQLMNLLLRKLNGLVPADAF